MPRGPIAKKKKKAAGQGESKSILGEYRLKRFQGETKEEFTQMQNESPQRKKKSKIRRKKRKVKKKTWKINSSRNLQLKRNHPLKRRSDGGGKNGGQERVHQKIF